MQEEVSDKPKGSRKRKPVKRNNSSKEVSFPSVSAIKESTNEIEPELELPTLDGPYYQSVEEGISWEDFSDPYASSLDDSVFLFWSNFKYDLDD